MNNTSLVMFYKLNIIKEKKSLEFLEASFSVNDEILSGEYKHKNLSDFVNIVLTNTNKGTANIKFLPNTEILYYEIKLEDMKNRILDYKKYITLNDLEDFHKKTAALIGIEILFPFQIDENYEDKKDNWEKYFKNFETIRLVRSKKANMSTEEEKALKKLLESVTTDIVKDLDNYNLCEEETEEVKVFNDYDIKRILKKINRKVIGQEEGIKNILSNIIANQIIIDFKDRDMLNASKANILIEASTGVGKTLILDIISKELKIPMVITSSTKYSGVGYKGEDLSDILVTLLRKTNGNLEKARRGIIVFDEIDKLGDTDLEIRKGIQEELLTWMSGTKIQVRYDGKMYQFDTSNITFIGMGAFTNMRESKKTRQIGFNSKVEEETFNAKDFNKAGILKELIGRFNTRISLNTLSKEDLKDILIYSEISPLINLIKFIESFNVSVNYEESLIEALANKAYSEGTGARGLQLYTNKIKSKILFHLISGNINSIYLCADMLNDDFILEENNRKVLEL